MNCIGRFAVLLLVATMVPGMHAAAQIGGLVKKRVGQAAESATPAPASVGEPVAFDDVVLELTAERIASVGAGKAAGRKAREAPDGPVAIRERTERLDARQAAIYEKHVEDINAWDGRRMEAERCRDSIMVEIADGKRATSAEEFLAQNRQLALDVARAQQRGDTAEVARLMRKLEASQQPTRADSLAAERSCGVPAPPPAWPSSARRPRASPGPPARRAPWASPTRRGPPGCPGCRGTGRPPCRSGHPWRSRTRGRACPRSGSPSPARCGPR